MITSTFCIICLHFLKTFTSRPGRWLVVGSGTGPGAQLLAIKRITMSSKPVVNVRDTPSGA